MFGVKAFRYVGTQTWGAKNARIRFKRHIQNRHRPLVQSHMGPKYAAQHFLSQLELGGDLGPYKV